MIETRTLKQNSSLHLALRQAADKLNDAGIGQRDFWENAKKDFDIPHSENSIKEIFQRICGILHGEERTSKLTTKELQQAFEVFALGMAQSCGVVIVWPEDSPPLIEEHECN